MGYSIAARMQHEVAIASRRLRSLRGGCRLRRPPVGQGRPHPGRDLLAEKRDRAQQGVARHRPKAHLHEEAVLTEEAVKADDLVGHRLDVADEEMAARTHPCLVLLARQGRPATL